MGTHPLTDQLLLGGGMWGPKLLKLGFLTHKPLKLSFDVFKLGVIFIQTKIYIIMCLFRKPISPKDPYWHIGTFKEWVARV